ncbi:MAG: MFS transporter [Saprospiraceae bacterium]
MKHFGTKFVLYINYFVFAVLLNTMGAVILQVQGTFGVSKDIAALLEGFKDIPIALASLLLASFLPKLGYKRAMQIALAMVTVVCIIMPYASAFWYFKLLFFVVGVSFAMIKVSVFSTIGLVTDSQQEHSSLMSTIEGVFMVGILFGNVLFSLFINDADTQSREWLNVYWVLGGLTFMAFIVLLFVKIDQSRIQHEVESSSIADNLFTMLKLCIKPVVLIFIGAVAFYVLIEQSFQTWMPTFYKDVLKLPASMSIQAGAVLAGAFAIGRFTAGVVLRRIHWLKVVLGSLVLSAVCVTLVISLSKGVVAAEGTTWMNAPLAAWLFPVMGIFLATIYPAINSLILSALPKHQHAAMSGLIVVFSALGGTTGSIITGNIFHYLDGATAFSLSVIPMGILALLLVLFNSQIKSTHG